MVDGDEDFIESALRGEGTVPDDRRWRVSRPMAFERSEQINSTT